MSHFCLLKDPDNYSPTDWDLLADAQGRAFWLTHFEDGFAEAMRHAERQYGRPAKGRIEAASREFAQEIQTLRDQPDALPGGKLDILALDYLRQRVLRKHRLEDPYRNVRMQDSVAAAKLYDDVVKKLHVMDDEAKWLHLVQCVFAGNVYDLGTASTAHLTDAPIDFLKAIEDTPPRPWLVDDYDAVAEHLLAGPPPAWAKAVVFLDNAGADFVLGVMPLLREMALHGTMICLAANEGPALNDILVDETIEVVEQLAARDPDLLALIEANMIEVVSTGCTVPRIDLSNVSDELNEAAADADLVLLEGMGRAVESNWAAAFRVDCLRLARLKTAEVAARLGGQVFDCVCKYTPAE